MLADESSEGETKEDIGKDMERYNFNFFFESSL